MTTAYDMLGVRPEATAADIRVAFYKLAKAYHPDLHAPDAHTHERFRAIIAAHDLLKTKGARAAYDARLKREREEAVRRRKRYFVGYVLSAGSSFGIVSAGLLFWQDLRAPLDVWRSFESLQVERLSEGRAVPLENVSGRDSGRRGIGTASPDTHVGVDVSPAAPPAQTLGQASEPVPQGMQQTAMSAVGPQDSSSAAEADRAGFPPASAPGSVLSDRSAAADAEADVPTGTVNEPEASARSTSMGTAARDQPPSMSADAVAHNNGPFRGPERMHALIRVWTPDFARSTARAPAYAARVFTVAPEAADRPMLIEKRLRIRVPAKGSVHALRPVRHASGRTHRTAFRPPHRIRPDRSGQIEIRQLVRVCPDAAASPIYPPAANSPRAFCR
ncbi:MAG TPA: J domain-containing protein [Xanthobacteraceae bacterium]|nr:J domain-containing protein [Xanthobacteraceae bacterium]